MNIYNHNRNSPGLCNLGLNTVELLIKTTNPGDSPYHSIGKYELCISNLRKLGRLSTILLTYIHIYITYYIHTYFSMLIYINYSNRP